MRVHIDSNILYKIDNYLKFKTKNGGGFLRPSPVVRIKSSDSSNSHKNGRLLEPPDHTEKLPHFRRKCKLLICKYIFPVFEYYHIENTPKTLAHFKCIQFSKHR